MNRIALRPILAVLAIAFPGGCSMPDSNSAEPAAAARTDTPTSSTAELAAAVKRGELQIATFAGGCFWCMEPPFEKLKGVYDVTPGYTGGHVANPAYEQVCAGTTGHAESVQVIYDPKVVTYDKLLETFWHNIDPTAEGRQFYDIGSQYRTAIFYHGERQKELAEKSKKALAESGKFDEPIVTEIVAASTFYPAEDYHKDYYKKNAASYQAYKIGSGRAAYLEETWGEE